MFAFHLDYKTLIHMIMGAEHKMLIQFNTNTFRSLTFRCGNNIDLDLAFNKLLMLRTCSFQNFSVECCTGNQNYSAEAVKLRSIYRVE